MWTLLRSDRVLRNSSSLCGGSHYADRTAWASGCFSRGRERDATMSRQKWKIIRTDSSRARASCLWALGPAAPIFPTSSRLSNLWKVIKMSILGHAHVTVPDHAHHQWCFLIHCGRWCTPANTRTLESPAPGYSYNSDQVREKIKKVHFKTNKGISHPNVTILSSVLSYE